MNVGVYASYRPGALTYAALQVADLARRCDNRISVYTTTPRHRPVHALWDDRVVRGVKFTDWAEPLDLIVWVGCPLVEQVHWALRERKGLRRRKAVLVATWDDTGAMVQSVYPVFTAVVAPSAAAGRAIDHAGVHGVRTIPWSPCLPITRRPGTEGTRSSLHFPLCDADRAQDPVTVDIVERLLRRGVDADIRVTLTGRSGEVVRRLERRAREHPNLTLARCGDYEAFVRALGAHDLTILPGAAETFGMTALCSLHAGAPVVAFDAPPVAEFVSTGRNGVLVPGAATGVPPGTAQADARDHAKFETTLARVLVQGLFLHHLRTECSAGLAGRTRDFEQLWGNILQEA